MLIDMFALNSLLLSDQLLNATGYFDNAPPAYAPMEVLAGDVMADALGDDSRSAVKTSIVTFPPHQWAMLTIRLCQLSGAGVNTKIGVGLRDAGPGSDAVYEFNARGQNGSNIARTNGGYTVLASETTTDWVAGDRILGTVVGYTLTLYRIPSGSSTPSQLLQATDTDTVNRNASGQISLLAFVNDGAITDCSGYDFRGGAIVLPTRMMRVN